MAAFSVHAPSWKRYSGQMSMVPPARSMRVGAEEVSTAELYRVKIQGHVARRASSSDRSAADCRLRRHARRRSNSDRWRASSDWAAQFSSRATSKNPGRWQNSRSTSPGSRRRCPAWVSVDQEGGRVARLKAPFTEWPPMATLGRSGDVALAERFARALATELRAVGITLDYAPGPRHPHQPEESGHRRSCAGGSGTNRCPTLGAAIVRVLQAEGVAACGKHFPGHGDTSTDSHLELPLVEHPRELLREREFLPFAAAIAAGVATIMTAHVFMPALDEQRPATLSKTDHHRSAARGTRLSGRHSQRRPRDEGAGGGAFGDRIGAPGDRSRVRRRARSARAITTRRRTRSRPSFARWSRLPRSCGGWKMRWLAIVVRRSGSSGQPSARRPLTSAALRRVLGQDEHRRIADDMARFA